MFNKQLLLLLNKYKDPDLSFEYIVTAGALYTEISFQGYLRKEDLSIGSINKNTFKEYTINGVFNKSMGYGYLCMYFSLNNKLISPFTHIKIHGKQYGVNGALHEEFDASTTIINDNLYQFDKAVALFEDYKLKFNFIEAY